LVVALGGQHHGSVSAEFPPAPDERTGLDPGEVGDDVVPEVIGEEGCGEAWAAVGQEPANSALVKRRQQFVVFEPVGG
jgi:hypothetical protein